MIPGWMGSRRLAELIGAARARHLRCWRPHHRGSGAANGDSSPRVAETKKDLQRSVTAGSTALFANGPAAMALVKGLLAHAAPGLHHHHARGRAGGRHRGLPRGRPRIHRETHAGYRNR